MSASLDQVVLPLRRLRAEIRGLVQSYGLKAIREEISSELANAFATPEVAAKISESLQAAAGPLEVRLRESPLNSPGSISVGLREVTEGNWPTRCLALADAVLRDFPGCYEVFNLEISDYEGGNFICGNVRRILQAFGRDVTNLESVEIV